MPRTRRKRIGSIKTELVNKSREAAMAAVQIFNNPQISFKSELFIVTMHIAWTYLLHAYYRNSKIDYRYYSQNGERKRFDKTKHGADKRWELERCLNDKNNPLDSHTSNNLRFLITLRHEIEHQMTSHIDDTITAKFQACALNYNHYVQKFFGERNGIDKHLPVSLQFSAVSRDQLNILSERSDIPKHISACINRFEDELSLEEFQSTRYAYRVLLTGKTANSKGQADEVITFVKADSEMAQSINKTYALIKETERPKYPAGYVVQIMRDEGYPKFNMYHHIQLWKKLDGKNPAKGYGVTVVKNWYWYESWLKIVRTYCEENRDKYV